MCYERNTRFKSIKLEWKQNHPPIFYIIKQLIMEYPGKKTAQQSREQISHSNYTHIFEKRKCRTVKGKVFFGEMSSVQRPFCKRITFLTCKRWQRSSIQLKDLSKSKIFHKYFWMRHKFSQWSKYVVLTSATVMIFNTKWVLFSWHQSWN